MKSEQTSSTTAIDTAGATTQGSAVLQVDADVFDPEHDRRNDQDEQVRRRRAAGRR
jgi:hypothetical protein